jgi:hypothetical protein
MRLLLLYSALLSILAACSVTDDQAHVAMKKFMSGEAIRALLSRSRSLTVTSADFRAWLTLRPGGTGVGFAMTKSGSLLDLSGTWQINGDQFCRKWAFNAHQEICEHWERVGIREIVVYVDGNAIATNKW